MVRPYVRYILEGQKWRPKPAPPMGHPTNLTHIQMARTNKRAMNSALPGDMGIQTPLIPTFLTIWHAHSHTLTHCWTMSLPAPVPLAPPLDLTTTLHVLAAVIVILWLLKRSNSQ